MNGIEISIGRSQGDNDGKILAMEMTIAILGSSNLLIIIGFKKQ